MRSTVLPRQHHHTSQARRNVCTQAGKKALVVGGGFAGLAAAKSLINQGNEVVLVDQSRGLGGRVCTRRAKVDGNELTFDHAAQYLAPKGGSFLEELAALTQQGVIRHWAKPDGTACPVGDVKADAAGMLQFDTFKPYDAKKKLWVGVPKMSCIGRHVAASLGDKLTVLTGTRVSGLRWDGAAGSWAVNLESAGRVSPSSIDLIAKAASQRYDLTVTAVNSVAASKLLAPLAPAVSQAADKVDSNLCWGLMLALRKKTGIPFDGAIVSWSESAPPTAGGRSTGVGSAEGSIPVTGGTAPPPSLAWIGRESSKPGRAAPCGGEGECWVLHARPEWSNARAGVSREEAAQQLLSEFIRCCHLQGTINPATDVLYLEAFPWPNAFPVTPRPAEPLAGSSQPGNFMLLPHMKLGVAGDWLHSPRAGDAWDSGAQLGQAMGELGML